MLPATLAKVIERDADLDLLPTPLPAPLLRTLRRALAKNPRVRLRDIGDALAEIEEATTGVDETSSPIAIAPEATRSPRSYVTAAGFVVVALLAASIMWMAIPTANLPLRKSERLIEGLQPSFRTRPSLSPHGERLLYRTDDGLWAWSLDELAPRELRNQDGTPFLGGTGASFWSPDGQFVAFAHEGRLLRASVDGGAVTLICELDDLLIAGAWSDDDTIVFAAWRGDLFEVPAAGGTPRPYLSRDPETEVDFHHIEFLPYGRGLLYSVHRRERGHVGVYAEGRRRVLIDGAGGGSYSPSGHVVYSAAGRIWGVPFSLTCLETSGDPFVIAAGGTPRVSSDGTLSYVSRLGVPPVGQLVRVDGDGRVFGMVSQPRARMSAPAVAPDGNRVAVYAVEDDEAGNWVYDVARDTSTRIFAWEGTRRTGCRPGKAVGSPQFTLASRGIRVGPRWSSRCRGQVSSSMISSPSRRTGRATRASWSQATGEACRTSRAFPMMEDTSPTVRAGKTPRWLCGRGNSTPTAYRCRSRSSFKSAIPAGADRGVPRRAIRRLHCGRVRPAERVSHDVPERRGPVEGVARRRAHPALGR